MISICQIPFVILQGVGHQRGSLLHRGAGRSKMGRCLPGHGARETLSLPVPGDDEEYRHGEQKDHGGQHADHDRHVRRVVVFRRRDRKFTLRGAVFLHEDVALYR